MTVLTDQQSAEETGARRERREAEEEGAEVRWGEEEERQRVKGGAGRSETIDHDR